MVSASITAAQRVHTNNKAVRLGENHNSNRHQGGASRPFRCKHSGARGGHNGQQSIRDNNRTRFERSLPHLGGASVAATYAGAMPARVEKFVNIEGIGGPLASPDEVPRRYARWLQQLARGSRQRPYMDFDDFAERMMSENPNLTPERAQFLVRHWGQEDADGSVVRRADPAHMRVKPTIWRLDESMACWREINAPMLWVEGAQSRAVNSLRGEPDGYETRLRAFQTLANVVTVENAGHNVHHDQPERLAEAIESFM